MLSNLNRDRLEGLKKINIYLNLLCEFYKFDLPDYFIDIYENIRDGENRLLTYLIHQINLKTYSDDTKPWIFLKKYVNKCAFTLKRTYNKKSSLCQLDIIINIIKIDMLDSNLNWNSISYNKNDRKFIINSKKIMNEFNIIECINKLKLDKYTHIDHFLNYFEWMRPNEMIEVWEKINEDVDLITIIDIIISLKSDDAIEFALSRMNFIDLDKYFSDIKTMKFTIAISKKFIDLVIKKYPILYDNVYYMTLMTYKSGIIDYFPDTDIHEMMLILEKYHEKNNIN